MAASLSMPAEPNLAEPNLGVWLTQQPRCPFRNPCLFLESSHVGHPLCIPCQSNCPLQYCWDCQGCSQPTIAVEQLNGVVWMMKTGVKTQKCCRAATKISLSTFVPHYSLPSAKIPFSPDFWVCCSTASSLLMQIRAPCAWISKEVCVSLLL